MYDVIREINEFARITGFKAHMQDPTNAYLLVSTVEGSILDIRMDFKNNKIWLIGNKRISPNDKALSILMNNFDEVLTDWFNKRYPSPKDTFFRNLMQSKFMEGNNLKSTFEEREYVITSRTNEDSRPKHEVCLNTNFAGIRYEMISLVTDELDEANKALERMKRLPDASPSDETLTRGNRCKVPLCGKKIDLLAPIEDINSLYDTFGRMEMQLNGTINVPKTDVLANLV